MEWARAPLAIPALAFAAGILGGAGYAPRPLALLGAAAALVALAASAIALRREHLGLALLALGFVTLGCLRSLPEPLPQGHVAQLALPRTVRLEARLVEEPLRWAADRSRLLLETERILEDGEYLPASGVIQATLYGDPPPLAEGQRIAAELRLHRPTGFRNPGSFDHATHLIRRGIHVVGTGRADRALPLTEDAPPWPARVKRWAVTTIGAHVPGVSGALLAGLLLGERTALPREVEDAFRRAGVYHILAVSGFNVALLAAAVFGSLGLLGVGRRAAALVASIALVAFAMVVGAQPSVVRATVMGLAVLLALLLDRHGQIMNSLALSWLALLLWNPQDLWDPGFQLSFAATGGIVYLAPALRDAVGQTGLPPWLAAAGAVSLGAQLAVTPIMLAHFNQLSVVGPAANLAVVPLAGVATTLGALALVASLGNDLVAALLFSALWPVLLALRAAVWATAGLPWAMAHLPAWGWIGGAAWYGALALGPLLPARRWARAPCAALLAAALATAAWPWLRPADGLLRMIVLDVGQGDAALVELPGGQRLLIDGGPGGPARFDVGERVIAPFLWNRPVARLDVVVATHWDADHAGGLPGVIRHFRVGEIWENGRAGQGRETVLRAAARAGALQRPLVRGQRLWIGSTPIAVLGPEAATAVDRGRSGNDDSVVLRLDWGALSLLLTGDLGARGEADLLDGGAPLRALLLKVAHHGSRFSSSGPFLEAVRPAFAVVSAGARNPFRHPARATLERLQESGARIYRTDQDGAVILESDGASLWITRWASGMTERFDLDAEPGAENTAAPGTPRGPRWDARGTGGLRSRSYARTERAAAPAPPDQGACPERAPSPPGWS